jgi:hypothetical protein
MNLKNLLWAFAAITLAVVLCKVFLPEWIVSGFHIGR